MNLPTKFLMLATLPLLCLLANLGHASNDETGVQPPQKWYRVEVIIFAQKDVFGDEISSRDIAMSYPQRLIDLDDNHAGFIALATSEQELGPDAYSLARTGVYQILFHKAWRQPGLKPHQAPWVNIEVTKKNTALNGSLRVYLSSYLHMESNIWQVTYATGPKSAKQPLLDDAALLEEGVLQGSVALSVLPTPWPQPPVSPLTTSNDILVEHALKPVNPEPALLQPAPRDIEEIILLKQARRLKLNKLHYFDHPKMGILLKVSRSQPAVITPAIEPLVVSPSKPGAEPRLESAPQPDSDSVSKPDAETDAGEKAITEESPFGGNPALY
ncbi:hypothetical protein A9Q89_11585 [Gammaproteobacteria bacterium 53_120_T64]|nr:hypothetical protein A9Q89_11585 [Gammaproteobacteria bacterium 53_120_T64]